MHVSLSSLDLPFAVTEVGVSHGAPIIVLPGGPCRGPEYLGDLAGLGRARRLVVLHPRGTVLSGGRSRGWWNDADDVIALADALGVDVVDVIAHSAGTRLALAVAARHPHRLRSLVLVTPPATWLTGTTMDGDSIAIDRTDRAVADAILALEEDDAETEDSYRDSFQRQAPATYARWSHIEQAHAMVGDVSLAAARAWNADIPTDAVARIRAASLPRTLVVGGDRDYLTGVQPVVDYAAILGAALVLIERCGHYPWVEQPVDFLRVVDGWFAGGQRSAPRR